MCSNLNFSEPKWMKHERDTSEIDTQMTLSERMEKGNSLNSFYLSQREVLLVLLLAVVTVLMLPFLNHSKHNINIHSHFFHCVHAFLCHFVGDNNWLKNLYKSAVQWTIIKRITLKYISVLLQFCYKKNGHLYCDVLSVWTVFCASFGVWVRQTQGRMTAVLFVHGTHSDTSSRQKWMHCNIIDRERYSLNQKHLTAKISCAEIWKNWTCIHFYLELHW